MGAEIQFVRKSKPISPVATVAIYKALNPTVDPVKLLNKLQEENDGYIGGTIRHGSQSGMNGEFGSEFMESGVKRKTEGVPLERFSFGDMTFDIDAAKELCGGQANNEIIVDQAWSHKINIDKIAAMNSKSTNPVIIAQIPTEKGIFPILIDGHHRLFKAHEEKKKTIPAFVLTPEQTLFLCDTHPDLMTRMTQNLRDVTDQPRNGKNDINKARKPMNIQSLIFSKDKFTRDKAVNWAKKHGYKTGIDETGNSYRMRQTSPGDKTKFRTISLTEGISAVVAKSDPTASMVHVPSPDWKLAKFALKKEESMGNIESTFRSYGKYPHNEQIWSEIENGLYGLGPEGVKEGARSPLEGYNHDPHNIAALREAFGNLLEEEIAGQGHDPMNLNTLTRSFDDFTDEEKLEDEHSPQNMDMLSRSFDKWIDEENSEQAEKLQIGKIIRRVGGKYVLYSHKGKRLGEYDSREGAENRERQVNYFKNVKKDKPPRVLEGGGMQTISFGQTNMADGVYGMQQLVQGMDWEMYQNAVTDDDQAKMTALSNLQEDPDYYRKKQLELNNSPDLTMKDTQEGEDDPADNIGLMLDLGSGQAREPGHIGFDLHPYDNATVVHDIRNGFPFVKNESVKSIRMSNVPEVDPKILMSEMQRMLMPDGQFVYEGPSEIYNYPPYMQLAEKEVSNDPKQPWTKQTFRRLAMPDAATSNDAEPRIGIAQYDMLPADALLAMDAASYDTADMTSSGRGNRIHGYPSQGALVGKRKIPGVEDLGCDTTMAVSKQYCPIVKADIYKQIVYCVVLAPDETDLQGDIMTAEDIEETAHDYLLEARVIGSGHAKPMDAGVVECYIAPTDFESDGQFGPQKVKKGSWVIAIKIQDRQEWNKVLNGEYTGVSVGGLGQRTAIGA